jgi:hypothetical protein
MVPHMNLNEQLGSDFSRAGRRALLRNLPLVELNIRSAPEPEARREVAACP